MTETESGNGMDHGGDELMDSLRAIVAACGPVVLPDDLRPQRVLTPDLAAAYLGLSTHALRWHRYKKSGPTFVRLADNRAGYLIADLEEWITARRVAPQRPARNPGRPARCG